jgi:hypothetical protein
MEKIHKLPPKMKNNEWDKIISERLDSIEIIEAPDDAGPHGQFLNLLESFLARPNARVKEEMLLGKHWFGDEPEQARDGTIAIFAYFRSTDFIGYLQKQRFYNYKGHEIWAVLRQIGAEHKQFNVKAKCINVWGIPLTNQQQEAFDIPTFNKEVMF